MSSGDGQKKVFVVFQFEAGPAMVFGRGQGNADETRKVLGPSPAAAALPTIRPSDDCDVQEE